MLFISLWLKIKNRDRQAIPDFAQPYLMLMQNRMDVNVLMMKKHSLFLRKIIQASTINTIKKQHKSKCFF